MEGSYVWNFGDWLAGTAWMFFPPIAAYPLIVAMPHTRALFKDNAAVDGKPVDKELGWFGLVMAPLVTSPLAPIVLSIYIAALTYYGVGRETVFGWVSGGVNLITSIVFLATIGKDVHPAVRWLLLFIIPFIGLLVHAIYVLARGGSDPRHLQLALGSLVPCVITAGLHPVPRGLAPVAGPRHERLAEGDGGERAGATGDSSAAGSCGPCSWSGRGS